MYALNPPSHTHPATRERLRRGRAVGLEDPGWQDTLKTRCPLCGKPCVTFKAEPALLFHYGANCAHPHICDQREEPGFVPAVVAKKEARLVAEHMAWRRGGWPPDDGLPVRRELKARREDR